MDNQITNDDIDMLNESEEKQESENNSHDEDNYIFETDTKTPGEILDDFCTELKDINTTLPDSVINHYMKKSGFVVNDEKLVKIISIASQKFISEIVNDVMQHHRLKTKSSNLLANQAANSAGVTSNANSGPTTSLAAGSTGASVGAASSQTGASKSKTAAQQPLTLTLEDLTQVLSEYGINVKKPYYFM